MRQLNVKMEQSKWSIPVGPPTIDPSQRGVPPPLIFITALYARPGEVLQFGAKRMRRTVCTRTSQIKYTLQGCVYNCVHTLTYVKKKEVYLGL